MKKTLSILLLFMFNFTFSQSGKVYPKNQEINPGEENTYIYKPANGKIIPENTVATVVYLDYQKKSFPLIKREQHYEFTVKVPDSIDVFILAINDSKYNLVDNNLDKGYVVFLKNSTKEESVKSKLSYLQQWNVANYFIKLKILPEEIIAQFEELYQVNPALKRGNSYKSYLYTKYDVNKESIKQEIIDYTKQLSLSNDEKSLLSASEFYDLFKMKNENDELEKIILQKFPKGELAKRKFYQLFYAQKDKTEQDVLDGLQRFTESFNDYSVKTKDQFYSTILDIHLKNKDTINIKKYENLITNKISVANLYNSHAWILSGQDLSSPGNDLELAEQLSKTTLDIIINRKNNPKVNDDEKEIQGVYNMFADTYALILYKLKKYELAFQYEHKIALQNELDTGGKERYAVYAEKAKGLEFAKNYIEHQLLEGVDSKVMINQLQEIYKNLKLPENEFERIKSNSLKLATKKAKEELIKMYGDAKAIDFSLTNLDGKKVKLSDYRGKVVVLDFWATWCGPCRATFPKMQKLVNNYKKDPIAFLFINTWERNSPEEIKKNVTKFIKDNRYSFNVLFDFDDTVVAKYKVQGIPAKIVIDKKGNIISINSSDSNLVALIDENIK